MEDVFREDLSDRLYLLLDNGFGDPDEHLLGHINNFIFIDLLVSLLFQHRSVIIMWFFLLIFPRILLIAIARAWQPFALLTRTVFELVFIIRVFLRSRIIFRFV